MNAHARILSQMELRPFNHLNFPDHCHTTNNPQWNHVQRNYEESFSSSQICPILTIFMPVHSVPLCSSCCSMGDSLHPSCRSIGFLYPRSPFPQIRENGFKSFRWFTHFYNYIDLRDENSIFSWNCLI